MPSVRFHVEITPLGGTPGFQSTGADNVRFLISANAGEALGRISKIASGGELSRIMLALKNVFAERDDVPSMVFDEVDAGVSGVAAQRVGEKLGSSLWPSRSSVSRICRRSRLWLIGIT